MVFHYSGIVNWSSNNEQSCCRCDGRYEGRMIEDREWGKKSVIEKFLHLKIQLLLLWYAGRIFYLICVVGIYKWKILRKRKENTGWLREKVRFKIKKMTRIKRKKERKHALESNIQEKTVTINRKEGRKWKTQLRIKHLASFFRYIQFGRIETIISGWK